MLNRRLLYFALVLEIVWLLCGCRQNGGAVDADGRAKSVRVAFFPNVTHAPALVGTGKGFLQEALPEGVTIEERVFTAGPAEIEALFAGEVDLGYIGPGPALNGYLKSNGKALKIIAGASSGGAALVAAKGSGIKGVADLKGKRVAVPQTGGTQDISLRHALLKAGLKAKDKGGDVDVLQYAPADTLTLFQGGKLDAAWVPEPWITRLRAEAGAVVVLDERDGWPKREFASTVVVARTEFLEKNGEIVQAFLKGHDKSVAFLQDKPEEAQAVVGERIGKLSGKPIPDAVLKEALSRTEFTSDPLKETVLTFADWSRELGYQREGRERLEELFYEEK